MKPYLCVHTLSKLRTHSLAGTAFDMVSDSVCGRGKFRLIFVFISSYGSHMLFWANTTAIGDCLSRIMS